MLDDADDGHRDPVEQRRTEGEVFEEQRSQGRRQQVQDVHLLERAHQRKEPDVEEDRAPVQFAQDVLEARRLHAVAEQFE